MFYCDPCGARNGWPRDFFIPLSHGKCEVCKAVAACFDVHSSMLPSKTMVAASETAKKIEITNEVVESVARDLFRDSFGIIRGFHQELQDEYQMAIYDSTREALEKAFNGKETA